MWWPKKAGAYVRPGEILTLAIKPQALRQVEVSASVKIGQVLLEDVLGTGIDVVASRDIPEV